MLIIAELILFVYFRGEMEQVGMEDWVYRLIGQGKYAFTLQEAKAAYPELPDKSLRVYLARLSKKGKIISLHRGFYLIVYPQYQSMGIMPPDMFIDGLMKYLNRPYYVGLLSAAQLHGAAHQAPQEYFVFTTFPTMRPLHKKKVKVNFVSIKEIPEHFLEKRKTSTGYIQISSPILTAIDLISFDKRIGYINRAATVLNELAEQLKPSDFNAKIIEYAKISALQRLGYVLEHVIDQPELSAALWKILVQKKVKLQNIKLHSEGEKKGYPVDKKWKVIINTEIEIDE